jgi:hypothetical protein
MSTELTEEEALQVVVILIEDEEKRRYTGINDALALTIMQLHRPLLPPR